MPEIWKSVVGFETLYEVSDHGRVRSVLRLDSRKHKRGGHPMKLYQNGRDYLVVKLTRDGKSKLRKVHQLVLEAFVGPRPEGAIGCHSDDVKLNNLLTNLYWGTSADNGADRVKNFRAARGERNGGGGKLEAAQVLKIRERLNTEQGTALAREFGVSKGTIYDIRNRRSWSHV